MSSGEGRRIHCLGAAGAGMLPLAILAKEAGYEVSAQDDAMTEKALRLLQKAGVSILGNDSNLQGPSGLVVRSSAISEENPLLKAALDARWTHCRRGEFFAELARSRKLIAVAGSHGKTTTTGMLHECLSSSSVEHSLMLGGLFQSEEAPGQLSPSEWLLAEIDESDGTIEGFDPEISVLLNVDYDHHTQYPTEEDYRNAFVRLARRTKRAVIVDSSLSETLGLEDCVESEKLFIVGPEKEVSFAFKDTFVGGGRLTVNGNGTTFSTTIDRSSPFNVNNAAFAVIGSLLVRNWAGLPESVFFPALDRRQACDYLSPTVSIFNDYAHHPEEIRQQVESLRKIRSGSLWVVFQPHRFSRTRHLLEGLAKSLSSADRLYLLDVYAASEAEQIGGRGKDLFEVCTKYSDACSYVESPSVLQSALKEALSMDSEINILFLGAGMTHAYASDFAALCAQSDERWGSVSRAIGSVATEPTRLKAGESLANKTTMRIGGAAERYFEPRSEAELAAAIASTKDAGIPVYILGRGSNLIVPDGGVSGLVIRLNHPYWKQYRMIGEDRIWIGAGMRIKELCGVAAKLGLGGFEFLEGIPGNLGGALRMNAGAMGGWVFDVVESVRFVGSDGQVYEKERAQLTYGYRHCLELTDAVAIGAVLQANASGQERDEIRAAIGTYQEKRHESQPREPSAGCIFKNPEGNSAGKIIDELGLKGTAIGGAKISEVHGNFIVNTGGASSQDVIDLVKLARRVAWDKKRVELEPEALLYGSEWKVVLQ